MSYANVTCIRLASGRDRYSILIEFVDDAVHCMTVVVAVVVVAEWVNMKRLYPSTASLRTNAFCVYGTSCSALALASEPQIILKLGVE